MQHQGVRTIRGGEDARELGRRTFEQPLELEVQARESATLRPGRDPPGDGERLRDRDFLLVQLDGAVAHAARVDEHDAVGRAQKVGKERVGRREPRQERLHAVEDLAVRDAAQLRSTKACPGEESGRRGAHRSSRRHLPTAEDLDHLEVLHRTLVGDVERAEAVDLVAEAVDADRHVRGRREDVEDATAHRELTAVLDLVLAAVARAHEPLDEVLERDLGSLCDDDRRRARGGGAEALKERLHRRDDEWRRGRQPRRRARRSARRRAAGHPASPPLARRVRTAASPTLGRAPPRGRRRRPRGRARGAPRRPRSA